jgi:hypothetical protein
MLKPRAKEAQGSEDGITQWRSQSTASQRRAEYPHLGLGVGEKSDKKGSFGWPTVFIAGGKRELGAGRSCWRRTPASSQTGEPSPRAEFQYSSVTDWWASVRF